jgi:glutathione S-transferase
VIGKRIVLAVATQLGDAPYFLGDRPRAVDATVSSFLFALMDAPFPSAVRDHAEKQSNLRAYVDRMKARYWGDLPPRA